MKLQEIIKQLMTSVRQRSISPLVIHGDIQIQIYVLITDAVISETASPILVG